MANRTRQNIDERLIECLARGENKRDAAKLSACSESTVRRRMNDPDFVKRLTEYRETTFQRASEKMANMVDVPLDTLLDLLKAKDKPNIRLNASRAILEMALRYRESISFESRLARLEELAAANIKGGEQ